MKLTFHIGAGKTGSSAIQRGLAASRNNLAENGILVAPTNLEPGGQTGGHQVFAFQTIRDSETDEPRSVFRQKLHGLIDNAANSNAKQLIFSAENLSNPYPWADVVADSLTGHEVEVVIYIRRQDNYLLSAWQQWTLKQGIPFESWLYRVLGVMADWRVPIEEWEEITSPGRMIVRLYERERLASGDVTQDFFSVCDLPMDGLGAPKIVNRSYGIAAEELAISTGSLFNDVHDSGFFHFLDRYCQEAHLKQQHESRLTVIQRQSILARYRESNAWIKSRYFSGPEHEDIPPSLFAPPRQSDGRPPSRSDIEQGKLSILTEVVYGMHKENEARLAERRAARNGKAPGRSKTPTSPDETGVRP